MVAVTLENKVHQQDSEKVMSSFNAYRNNLPPGCTDADGGASDVYRCEDCECDCSQEELDPDSDDTICRACAEKRKEPSEEALRAEREATGDL